MSKKKLLLTLLLFLGGLGVISYQVTYALLSDSGSSTGNVFTTAGCFSTGSHVVINEVFYDVDSDHQGTGQESDWEWVELFNPTGSSVDLTSWSISDDNQSDTLPGSPIIPPCSYAIISPSNQAELTDQTVNGGRWTIPGGTVFITLSGAIGNGFNNGGDAVILKNSSNVEVDRMSYGTDTSGLNPAAIDVVSGHSLERNPDGLDTDVAVDFADRIIPTPGN